MTFSSEIKKFLYALRKKGVITEKYFVKSIDALKHSSTSDLNQLTPLLDMFRLSSFDEELLRLDESLLNIDNQMKAIIQAWEAGTLSKDEAKAILTNLVSQKKELIDKREQVQYRIQTSVSRLMSLKNDNNFDLEGFIEQLERDEEDGIAESSIQFRTLWSKYSSEDVEGGKLEYQSEKLDDVELEILKSLMVPISQEKGVIFDLDEVIQSIDHDEIIPSKSSLLDQETADLDLVVDHVEPLDSGSEQLPSSPWDLVGRIAYNDDKSSVGLFRPPIMSNGSVFLPVVKEESISLSKLKQVYKDVLNQSELDLEKVTTQQIRATIAKTLKVPEELALQPSIFNHWVGILGVEVVPAKPQLKKVWFVERSAINNVSSDYPTIKNEDLKQFSVPAWIPASGEEVTDSKHLGYKISGMAGSDFGTISGIMNKTPFGQCLIIKRDIPPSHLLDLFLKGLGKQNLAELRFSIAKKLNVGEGEVFSAENLWNLNNQERLLVSPHELASSYFSVLPAAAFTFTQKIQAKIGVYFHSIPETFRYLIGKPLVVMEEEQGMIYGFLVHQGKIFILWTPKNPNDLIREVGRKTSGQYVKRFQRRVSMALGISPEESLWPSNLARYFLNFIWLEEEQPLKEALSVIEKQFSLQKVSFSDVDEITKDGLKCVKNPG
ncbi:MAG: hypothetical protein JSV04_12285 [Candidatus Heimdallarchaeota archaeon]|nr:MAG: hypothetical protein JSV04_12285 [Candidatus Heimdallarchaeota archaeon]